MPRKYTPKEAQERCLSALATGATVKEAVAAASRTVKWYENLRAKDEDFKERANQARERAKAARDGARDPDLYSLSFADWRRRFLGMETYPHQQMWIDVLEGREPDVFHPAIWYEKGTNRRLVAINTPPFHAKSTTITQQWVTYKLCMNPALRVLLVSETQDLAKKFLHSVKTYLNSPMYAELQAAYAPEGGFKPKQGDGSWGATAIYLNGRGDEAVDKAAKDPSVQAVGIRGQIYGVRADLTILDDCVSLKNAHDFENQFDWLTQEVMSRSKNGIICAVGTRVATSDLYSHLMNPDTYITGKVPWTYIAQPAVLEFAEHPRDWTTLWPKSSVPLDENGEDQVDENGLYPAMPGETLNDVRSSNSAKRWALVYMQQSVPDDATFHPKCVWGSVDRRRKPGPLIAGALGHPKDGPEGKRVVLSIDPAGTGEAFLLVYAFDRVTRQRYVLNAWVATHTKPSWYAERIEEICPLYGVDEVVIESNAYASWIIHDERIRSWCQNHGVRITGHFTGRNKQDPDFGVATLATLFGTLRDRVSNTGDKVHAGDNIVHLPDPDKSAGVKALVDQLLTWQPGKLGRQLRQDGPMALWFAELRARNHIVGGDKPRQTHRENRFMSARHRRRQVVVPISAAS